MQINEVTLVKVLWRVAHMLSRELTHGIPHCKIQELFLKPIYQLSRTRRPPRFLWSISKGAYNWWGLLNRMEKDTSKKLFTKKKKLFISHIQFSGKPPRGCFVSSSSLKTSHSRVREWGTYCTMSVQMSFPGKRGSHMLGGWQRAPRFVGWPETCKQQGQRL